jgi:hypothetical protein
MKRYIILFILALKVSFSYSQKAKTIDVAKIQLANIYANISYNSNGVPSDTSYVLVAKDDRYQYLNEYITLYQGNIRDLFHLIVYSIEFMNKEETGILENYKGNKIYSKKIGGFKCVSINGIEKDSDSSCTFNQIMLNKLKNKIENWCKINKIELN